MSRYIVGFYVKVNGIWVMMLEIDLGYFVCLDVLDGDMVLDEDSEYEDNVKYFEMFLNEGLENICRFIV